MTSTHNSPFGGSSGTFDNAGTLNWNGTYATWGYSDIDAAFNNTGTVNVNDHLRLTNGGTDTGSYSVANGKTLTFASGTRNLDTGSNISGTGTLAVTSGTVNVTGGFDISTTGTALNLSGGTLNLNNALSVGTLNLSGGTLGGAGNLTTTGPFNITGNRNLILVVIWIKSCICQSANCCRLRNCIGIHYPKIICLPLGICRL